MVDAGVTVFKIEGRARGPEYVRTVAGCYDEALRAICEGTYSDERIDAWNERLGKVFNRGFWDGYYQGAVLGQWSDIYGSQSTRRKVYAGKVTNWFDRIGVAEIAVESCPISVGDSALAIGATTGVVEFEVKDMRVNLKPVQTADKGVYCSIALDTSICPDGKLRRGDKIFIWKDNA
jgi:putative protease